jgi:hypothetical protein
MFSQNSYPKQDLNYIGSIYVCPGSPMADRAELKLLRPIYSMLRNSDGRTLRRTKRTWILSFKGQAKSRQNLSMQVVDSSLSNHSKGCQTTFSIPPGERSGQKEQSRSTRLSTIRQGRNWRKQKKK